MHSEHSAPYADLVLTPFLKGRARMLTVRNVIRSLPIGLIAEARDGFVRFANPALVALLRHRDETALRGARLESLVHPEDWTDFEGERAALWTGDSEGYEATKRLLRSDGTWASVKVRAMPVKDRKGQVNTILRFIDAVEPARRRASPRANGITLTAASHQLRTPLSVIVSALDQAGRLAPGGEVGDLMTSARRAAAGMSGVLDRVLGYTALADETEPGRKSHLALFRSLAQIVAQQAGEVRAASISVRLRSSVPRTILADAEMLDLATSALVAGAASMADTPEIELSAALAEPVEARKIRIEVGFDYDAGKEQSARDQDRTERNLDIGLARAFAARLGSNLHFVRETVQRVRMWFDFPYEPSVATNLISEITTPEASPSRLRILLAEDAPLIAKLMRRLIEDDDCEVEVANDGRSAVDIASAGRFDLVIMDIEMPVLSGLDAVRDLRALGGEWKTTPIVAMTAHALPGARQHYLDAGFTDFLPKPVTAASLASLLRQIRKGGVIAGRSVTRPHLVLQDIA